MRNPTDQEVRTAAKHAKLEYKRVLWRANHIYGKAFPNARNLPKIESEQLKALLKAICDEFNNLLTVSPTGEESPATANQHSALEKRRLSA